MRRKKEKGEKGKKEERRRKKRENAAICLLDDRGACPETIIKVKAQLFTSCAFFVFQNGILDFLSLNVYNVSY